MELFDEDTFNTDLIDAGTKKVKEENGFFSSLEDSISNGLIKGLSNLISDSGMFNKIVDDIPEERKAIRIDRGRIERGDKTENNSRAENKGRVDNSSDKSSQKKGKIGKILEKIISFFKGNKHKKMETVSNEETNTLINNQNMEIVNLKKENEMLKTQLSKNSERMEKLIDILVDYVDRNQEKTEKENTNISKSFKAEKKDLHNM
jgi:hypothetical protein